MLLRMKKFFLVCSAMICLMAANAQNKLGYIATDELISLMPEAEKADAELKEYQSDLALRGQDLMRDLSYKDSIFVKDSAKMSNSMREIKKDELLELYQKVQNWNQKAQDMYQQKAQELIAPLRTKAMDAIKAVAKENGYTYVFDMNSLIVAPPGDDILELVKKKLGVKESSKPGTAPKRN